MPGPEKNPRLLDEPALALAFGRSARKWAQDNSIAERTGHGWAASPGFRGKVDGHRQKLNDATLGKIVRLARKATSELEKTARSERIRRGQTRSDPNGLSQSYPRVRLC
jgi:hypothetical protein